MEINLERQRFFQWRDRFIAEGNCVGLKFKTKIYHLKARGDKDHQEAVDTCSICILELKDRDRIADLSCNHYFHANCLSEWIKKKVRDMNGDYYVRYYDLILIRCNNIYSHAMKRIPVHCVKRKGLPKKYAPMILKSGQTLTQYRLQTS